jgi:hypothetical protein
MWTPVRRPHMFSNIPVVGFLGCGYALKCLDASLWAVAESGTFAFLRTMPSDATGPKRRTGGLSDLPNHLQGVFWRLL